MENQQQNSILLSVNIFNILILKGISQFFASDP